ncbi:HAD family hydrolase [Marinitenerispora sediminis]|uniref:Haloacid dehalogenase n=1 Tax=Marinitenerispora sediminis TaxID=1931232 RepID=A0A368T745_9ACTN|nr:HAD family hydrolase [Marinitenerispora sediminis]RCV48485.1 haloacid dehalogenase [Marinitenerispora sediminis]RCV52569.1 haloacid dehalogenase [Marinitenerispora sediminis]RCV59794.1 haloacid dehalogenase [Marinitenerispora sediminis]
MPEHTSTPAVIFFDLDDTLLDEHAASSAGLRTLMERLGHPDFNAARRLWDVQTDISFGNYIAGRLTLTEQRRERVRALATQAGHSWVSEEHCDELFQRYLESHRSAWRSFHDVVPALTQLASAGIGLGVITNGIEALQREKLSTLEITRHFSTIVCADTAGVGKPDPRVFHIACQQLGVAPNQCWHIGDQLRADALGAISAGLRPVLLDRHHRYAGEPTDIATIHSLEEVHKLLGPSSTAAAAGLL